MSVEGARKLALTADGNVDIETAAGAMKLQLPRIYQDTAGVRQPVRGGYVLEAGNVIGFRLAGYDNARPLVIDPTLVYATFFGSGAGFDIDAITTDSLGYVYLAGEANAGMATVNAFQSGDTSRISNCFVMKLDPTGTTVLYATYLGGTTSNSVLEGIAVDSAGELAGTGTTMANDFPLVNAAWSTFDATNGQSGFVVKLSADGSSLVYSTLLSGAYGAAVAFDGPGNVYVVGDAYSTGVATSGAYQTVFGGGFGDAFVAKLSPAGALSYFTFLGGSGYDQGTAIAVDALGNAYVAGCSTSVSFPGNPPGAQTTNPSGGFEAFIAKVSADGSSVPWLTFLDGTGDSPWPVLARDSSTGILYIAGTTTSANLPTTAGVIQPAPKGPGQGFVASVNPDGMSFGFVTYLGGRKYDSISAITLTPTGQLAVAGTSSSYDFASVNAIQPAFVGNGISFFAGANSGTSWTAHDAGLPASILAITGDPSSPSTVLALSYAPLSVFRTTNGGTTWAAEPVGTISIWWYGGAPAFARSLANPAVVYAYIPLAEGMPPNDAVFRSSDDGVTWTSLTNPANTSDFLIGIALSATDANTLVEVFQSGAVYRSTDGGATFGALSPVWAFPCYAAYGAPMTGSPDGSFYLGTYGGFCKSTDNGSTWSLLSGSSALGYPPQALAVSPSNPLVLYAIDGSGAVHASADAGVTWNSGTTPGGSVSMLAVAASNAQVVYAAGSGGVFVSTDGATTWTPAASLPLSPSAIAVNPSDPTAVYAGGYTATDGFVAKLNTTGTSLLWSTFYTGSNGINPAGIASVASGDVWVAGTTQSADLPITANAYSSLGPRTNYEAGFLARISDTTVSCSYSLNPSSLISYGAQSLTFAVTAPSGCAWTATPSDSTWISVNTGSGTASGVVSAMLSANNTGATRTGSISISGQMFSITQASASCSYSATTPAGVSSSGGTVQINVTASAGCPWSVVPQGPGISVESGATGTGSGTVTLSLAPNASVGPVSSTVQVGPQSVSLSVADICSYSLSPLTLGQAAQSGTMDVTASPTGCCWYPQSDASWLSVNENSTTGSGTFPYTLKANFSGASRTAHITLDGRQFAVTQAAGPNPMLVGRAAGSSSYVLAYTGAWTATANDSFLHISAGSASGTGNALVVFTYDAFTGTGSRTGTLTIAGIPITVTQAGTNYIGPIGPSPLITLVSSGLAYPYGAAVDGSGNVYFADDGGNALKEWSASTQQTTTLVPSGLGSVRGVAVDGSGNVYFTDLLNTLGEWNASTQQVTTLVSSGLDQPWGAAVDGSGNVYIADSFNNAIKKWGALTQQVTTLVPAYSEVNAPYDVAVDGSGNLYIADEGDNALKEWNASTQQVTTLVSSGLYQPTAVAVDGSGNVYIADPGSNAIYEWSASTQQLTTLVSSGLNAPFSVAVDGFGNVYIPDRGNSALKEIPYAFVGPANLTEPSSAGTDSLLPVLPSTASLTGVFAPSSDQSWLTIGTITNGVVSFSFTANTSTSSRTAHIAVLGEQITVTQALSSAPAISNLSPASTAPGGTTFTLTVNGTSFVPGAGVDWNGTALATSFVSATQLTASVPATLIASAGIATVAVVNPGAVTSGGVGFPIQSGPEATAVSPGAGNGASQTFTFTFSDPSGYQNLGVLDVLINNYLDGIQACYVALVPSGANAGTLYLVDDGGDAGGPFAGNLALPGTGSVSNSQCTVSGTGSSVVGSGTTIMLTLNISFSASFAGNRIFYTAARDTGTGNSGWQALSTGQVPGATATPTQATGVTPASGSGASQSFVFTFADSAGWQDLGVVDVLFNSFLDGIQGCYIAYSVPAATLYLVDDGGDAGGPFAGYLALPGTGSMSNSQCTVSGVGSSVAGSGNTLTLTLNVSFTGPFAGNRIFYTAAGNAAGTENSGWNALGAWTVP
jgi:streptogramin lyase